MNDEATIRANQLRTHGFRDSADAESHEPPKMQCPWCGHSVMRWVDEEMVECAACEHRTDLWEAMKQAMSADELRQLRASVDATPKASRPTRRTTPERLRVMQIAESLKFGPLSAREVDLMTAAFCVGRAEPKDVGTP